MHFSFKKTTISKKTAMTPYALLVVCMGLATVLEKLHGKAFATASVYGTWWFAALWGLTVLTALVWLVRKRVHRRLPTALLHASFAVILLGALLTHTTAADGTLHLRKGETATAFSGSDGTERELPFSLTLSDFEEVRYPGTDAPMDYRAHLMVTDGGRQHTLCVAMNRIGKHRGYRFYQSAYDADGEGTVLLVASDPYGIAVTYTGYLLLLAGLVSTLFSRQTRIRRLLRAAMHPALAMLLMLPLTAKAQTATVERPTADAVAEVAVLYNGRICPLHTAATDFVTKLCGSSSWQGHSANEIFVSWIIFYTDWENAKIIKVKDAGVRKLLGIEGKWACVRDFYTPQHEYKLSGKAGDTTLPEQTRKAVRETDEKIQVVSMFYNSEMLRIFPLPHHGTVEWHKPGSTELPQGVGEAEFQFINHAMDHLVKAILDHDVARSRDIVARIRLYQREKAGHLLPSPARMKAEILYNSLQATLWPPLAAMVLSLVCCLFFFAARPTRRTVVFHWTFNVVLAVYISLLLALRWWISGHVPMSNGFETMLFMAWTTMVLTLCLSRHFPAMRAFGPVVASCCMLVAMLASGSPQVTPLMPVLQSPLLTVHVALVMMSYAIIATLTLIALRCLAIDPRGRESGRLTALSQFLLYPAVSLLAAGIFVGAVWANVAWGTYWSWDPKETWALITLMVYAVPLHRASIFEGSTPRQYHLYILLAFLTVLMTYFGVNHFLTGMHSYA